MKVSPSLKIISGPTTRSNKTRIETNTFNTLTGLVLVQPPDPTKQGLKHRIDTEQVMDDYVQPPDPTKQGLKPKLFEHRSVVIISPTTRSNKTRIETFVVCVWHTKKYSPTTRSNKTRIETTYTQQFKITDLVQPPDPTKQGLKR